LKEIKTGFSITMQQRGTDVQVCVARAARWLDYHMQSWWSMF